MFYLHMHCVAAAAYASFFLSFSPMFALRCVALLS
jgi:hypothetical protein